MKIKDILLGGLVLFSACLLSCQDDELISVSEVPQTITRNTTDAASGLTKMLKVIGWLLEEFLWLVRGVWLMIIPMP